MAFTGFQEYLGYSQTSPIRMHQWSADCLISIEHLGTGAGAFQQVRAFSSVTNWNALMALLSFWRLLGRRLFGSGLGHLRLRLAGLLTCVLKQEVERLVSADLMRDAPDDPVLFKLFARRRHRLALL